MQSMRHTISVIPRMSVLLNRYQETVEPFNISHILASSNLTSVHSCFKNNMFLTIYYIQKVHVINWGECFHFFCFSSFFFFSASIAASFSSCSLISTSNSSAGRILILVLSPSRVNVAISTETTNLANVSILVYHRIFNLHICDVIKWNESYVRQYQILVLLKHSERVCFAENLIKIRFTVLKIIDKFVQLNNRIQKEFHIEMYFKINILDIRLTPLDQFT